MRNGKTQLAAIILAAVIAFCFGAVGGVAGIYLADRGVIRLPEKVADVIGRFSEEEQQEAQTDVGLPAEKPQPVQPVINVSSDVTIAEAIAEKVLPSVVGISTVSEYTSSGFGDYGFWGFGNFGFGNPQQTYEATAIGTGVIVDESGYILTNSHVVNDGDVKTITVSLFDGSDTEGTVLWNDPTLDLAVVKIEGKDLVSAELGDSDVLRIGSYAAAIGNPLGLEFERSMSQGIISGLDRSIEVENSSSSTGSITMEGLLQTDATINSGNSGGPLLGSKGQVIGINTAKASDGEGMGFAIPINVAKPIVEQIKKTGKFIRPYIGISGSALEESKYASDVLIEHFGTDKGIYVHSVSSSEAKDAGLKEQDVIIELNGTPVNTMNKLNSLLVAYKPGDRVTLTVLREGKEIKLDVKLTDGVVLEKEDK